MAQCPPFCQQQQQQQKQQQQPGYLKELILGLQQFATMLFSKYHAFQPKHAFAAAEAPSATVAADTYGGGGGGAGGAAAWTVWQGVCKQQEPLTGGRGSFFLPFFPPINKQI
eukprot:1149958-Pelagomonas_calceolata.AAC.2